MFDLINSVIVQVFTITIPTVIMASLDPLLLVGEGVQEPQLGLSIEFKLV